MAVIRPPITGDPVQDSWTDQITKAINQGLIGGLSVSQGGGGGAGAQGPAGPSGRDGINSATLYLFRRASSGTIAPPDLMTELTYTYSTGAITDAMGSTGPFDGWYTRIPEASEQTGNYVWVITVNVTDEASVDTETIQASAWSAPTSLTSPDIIVTDPDTGQIIADGMLVGYLYRRLDSAYSTSPDGTMDFSPIPSMLPTGTTVFYQGLRNSDSTGSSTTPSEFIWERITLTEGLTTDTAVAQYRLNGGRQIDWEFAGSLINGFTVESGAVIDLDNLGIPGIPPSPGAIQTFTLNHVDADSLVLEWSFLALDVTFPGLLAVIEENIAGNWVEIAEVTYPVDSYQVRGVSSITSPTQYRVKAVNNQGIAGPPTVPAIFTPVTPSTPTGFMFTRRSPDLGEFSWTYTPNLSILRYFVIEILDPNNRWAVVQIADASERNAILTGLASNSDTNQHRIRAVSAADILSSPSNVAIVGPPTVQPPTDFTATPLERVGVLTTVDLTWTEPSDLVNTIVSYTIQFRPVTIPESAWFDVQVVGSGETEADNIPPQQGFVEYRIRATAINGINSAFVNSAQIFISGGSATDDAIFGGDGDFISTRHYSVNSEDIVISSDSIERVEGGTLDTANNRIEGVNGQQLEVDWIININPNQVERNRHFYLNLDNLVPVGTNPLNWGVDTGNVFVEILSDPAESENMYSNSDTTDPDDDRIYTDGSGSTASNTRTYSLRNVGSFMYATRTFIRLPMRRTFTFRDSGRVCVRFRFNAANDAHPRIEFNNPIRLEAFATELLDATTLTGVTNAGTIWNYATDFEAAPMIFTTPGDNCNTYFTQKTANSVRIHSTSTTGCDVDVTARGR